MSREFLCLLLGTGLALWTGCGSQEPVIVEDVDPKAASPAPPASVRIETRTDTVAAPTPAIQESPAASLSSGHFRVQLGAFKDQRRALEVQQLSRQRFALQVLTDFSPALGLYRVRIGAFATKLEAEEFRDRARKQYPNDYRDAWIITMDETTP